MIATQVTLNNYRNWARLSITPHERLNLVTGPNAQGKSNLLEALYALVTTRPYRANRELDVIRFGESFAHVHADFAAAGREVSCEVAWQRAAEGRMRKEVRLNRQPVPRLVDIFGVARIVLFAPRDLELVTGGPEARRRWVDIVLSQLHPTHLHALTRYRTVLAERGRILRTLAAGGSVDPALREALDEQLVTWGATIVERRTGTLQKFGELLEKRYRQLSGGRESIRLRYVSSAPCLSGESTAAAILRCINKRFRDEVERGASLFGPHRDDIDVLLDRHALRHFGSQGQIRSLSLAMRLAEAEMLTLDGGEPPLLLLDDCLSEMDSMRQDALWSYLSTCGQVFLTTSIWPHDQALPFTGRVFRVWEGTVQEQRDAA